MRYVSLPWFPIIHQKFLLVEQFCYWGKYVSFVRIGMVDAGVMGSKQDGIWTEPEH